MTSNKDFKKHEAKCEQCGKCCLGRLEVPWAEKTIPWGACPFFDSKTKKCLVYGYRFMMYPECLTVMRAMQERFLPDDCAYVRDFAGYHSIVDEWREDNDA